MADKKLSELDSLTTLENSDLIYIGEDAGGGTYVSKKITVQEFANDILAYSGTSSLSVASLSAFREIVGGSETNSARGDFTAVIGGRCHNVSGNYSFIGGGLCNTAEGNFGSVLGGQNNCITHNDSFIIGSNLTSDAACYTFVNNISTPGIANARVFLSGGQELFDIFSGGGGSQDLQSVTDQGNCTTDSIVAQGFCATDILSVDAGGKILSAGVELFGLGLGGQDLQEVTDVGATTDNVINAAGFCTTGAAAIVSVGANAIGVQGQILSGGFDLFALGLGTGTVGPQGATGPQGPQGYQGLTGPQGVAGSQGNAGPQGVAGTQGNQGFQGPKGDQGVQGPIGPQGSASTSSSNTQVLFDDSGTIRGEGGLTFDCFYDKLTVGCSIIVNCNDSNSSTINNASILGGVNNRVCGSIQSSNNHILAGGCNNVINSCSIGNCVRNNILGGYCNNIIQSNNSIIAGGYKNTIQDNSSFMAIVNGSCNKVHYSDGAITASYKVGYSPADSCSTSGNSLMFIAGSCIVDSLNSLQSSIISSMGDGTGGSKLNTATASSIIGGFRNCITTSSFSTILGGYFHYANTTASIGILGGGCTDMYCAEQTAIIGGKSNKIEGVSSACRNYRSVIISGTSNSICGCNTNNVIITGNTNQIHNDNAFQNVILGGISNKICKGLTGAVIAGGSNIEAVSGQMLHTRSLWMDYDLIPTEASTTMVKGVIYRCTSTGALHIKS